jgi:hypothetical protein
MSSSAWTLATVGLDPGPPFSAVYTWPFAELKNGVPGGLQDECGLRIPFELWGFHLLFSELW